MKTLIVRLSDETAALLVAAVPGIDVFTRNVLHSGDFGVHAGPVDRSIDDLLALGLTYLKVEATKRALREKQEQARKADLALIGSIWSQKARPATVEAEGVAG